MADIGEDVELGEVLLILLAVGIGIYFVKKFVSAIPGAVQDASKKVADTLNQAGLGEGTVTNKGTPVFSGPRSGSKTMTAAQAQSIAHVEGVGQNYTVSPDMTQVWFADGSYYDNPTGHLFKKDGTDLGVIACAPYPCTPDTAVAVVCSVDCFTPIGLG